MATQDPAEHQVCPRCKSHDVITDNDTLELVCSNCGFVLSTQYTIGHTSTKGESGELEKIGQNIRKSDPWSAPFGAPPVSSSISLANRTRRAKHAKNTIEGIAFQLPDFHTNPENEQCINIAHQTWILCYHKGMTRGYPREMLCAVCLYMACRQNERPYLLMDFAAILRINVFKLARVFYRICRDLPYNLQALSDPTIFIERFVNQLEFGDKTRDVANTAVRLVQRMRNDFINTGRRPSGVCGACILIAARMHGFRRTVPEIVRVVQLSDYTIRKRISEFLATPAAKMTVEQFTSDNIESSKEWQKCHPPPSYLRNKVKKEKANQLEQQKIKAQSENTTVADNTDTTVTTSMKNDDDDTNSTFDSSEDSSNSNSDSDSDSESESVNKKKKIKSRVDRKQRETSKHRYGLTNEHDDLFNDDNIIRDNDMDRTNPSQLDITTVPHLREDVMAAYSDFDTKLGTPVPPIASQLMPLPATPTSHTDITSVTTTTTTTTTDNDPFLKPPPPPPGYSPPHPIAIDSISTTATATAETSHAISVQISDPSPKHAHYLSMLDDDPEITNMILDHDEAKCKEQMFLLMTPYYSEYEKEQKERAARNEEKRKKAEKRKREVDYELNDLGQRVAKRCRTGLDYNVVRRVMGKDTKEDSLARFPNPLGSVHPSHNGNGDVDVAPSLHSTSLYKNEAITADMDAYETPFDPNNIELDENGNFVGLDEGAMKDGDSFDKDEDGYFL